MRTASTNPATEATCRQQLGQISVIYALSGQRKLVKYYGTAMMGSLVLSRLALYTQAPGDHRCNVETS